MLLLRLAQFGSSGGGGIAWSPSFKNAHVVLSNGNLTAATDATPTLHFAGRSATGIGAGSKKYWEVTINAVSAAHDGGVGVASAANTFADDAYLGSQASGLGYYNGDGAVFSNALTVTTLQAFGAGDVIGIACIGGSLIWFRVNGGSWNNDVIGNQNPATSTGGVDISALGSVFPAYDLKNEGAPAQLTANFTGSFGTAAPAGFTALP